MHPNRLAKQYLKPWQGLTGDCRALKQLGLKPRVCLKHWGKSCVKVDLGLCCWKTSLGAGNTCVSYVLPKQLLMKQKEFFWMLRSTSALILRCSRHLKQVNPLSNSSYPSPPLWALLLSSWGRDTSPCAWMVGVPSHPWRWSASSVLNKILELVQRHQVRDEFKCNRNVLPFPLDAH